MAADAEEREEEEEEREEESEERVEKEAEEEPEEEEREGGQDIGFHRLVSYGVKLDRSYHPCKIANVFMISVPIVGFLR